MYFMYMKLWIDLFQFKLGDLTQCFCCPLTNNVDLVIFACSIFFRISYLGLFTKIRIREFLFLFSSAVIIKIVCSEILEFANLTSSRNSRKLKFRKYYQIYSTSEACRTKASLHSDQFPVHFVQQKVTEIIL